VFIIGHLGGFGRRKVFPIKECGGKDKRVVYAQKADREIARIYKPEGLAPTLHLKTGGWQEPKITHPTLDASYYKSYSKQRKMLDINTRIRRLTPTECERLQGFPDGWTEGISDTQRYKCLGNAVTTNVITAIGKKLI
jgi:site-specific DNA-cytosine methylase